MVVLLALPLTGCALLEDCHSPDCSYAYAGLTATARFPLENATWNATRAVEGLRAAGFPDAHEDVAGAPGTVVAGDFGGRYARIDLDLAAGDALLSLGYRDRPGPGTSLEVVTQQANASWEARAAEAAGILARFENATGWRHEGGWVVAPIASVR